ncbi:MAG: type II toxin-antitoxin system RelE/ParE family toxin, partial [Candidatus Thioglobus sp.]
MINYSARALSDLTRLREFIAEKNPTAASRASSELKEEINKL